MFPAETLVINPAVHVRVGVLGHPELERVIEAPRGAPGEWLVAAYLLSIGVECHGDGDSRPSLQLWVQPWNDRVQVVEVPELPHLLEVTTSYARVPEVGEQQVCVLDDEDDGLPGGADPGSAPNWWADRPAFRRDAVNQELARMFGVVLPRFAGGASFEYGFEYGARASIERLLAKLSPVRRLALRAHLDEVGLAQEASAAGGEAVIALTKGVRSLLERFGPDGVAQDPATGWLPRGILERTAHELGWVADTGSLLPKPGEVLLALARRMRLIRRLRGDVVLTNRGHELLREPGRCRRELDKALGEVSSGWSWSGSGNEATLILLAIADGTIEAVDDIPEALERGRRALASGPESPGAGVAPEPSRSREVPGELRELIGVLAALSPKGGYGSFTPALRTLALATLC